MQIELIKAAKAHKTVMRQLLELYCYDFSEYLETDVNEHGMFEYQYVDAYWQEPDRHPFFIKVDGQYAGFVLLNKTFKIIDDPSAYTIAEFFVMRKYRRKGIGKQAAKLVLELFPGQWEIAQLQVNEIAVQFWNQVVEEVTQGNFTKKYIETGFWKKQVLIFRYQTK